MYVLCSKHKETDIQFEKEALEYYEIVMYTV